MEKERWEEEGEAETLNKCSRQKQKTNKNPLLTIFASDCTGWGEEGPGIPGTLGTMETGRTSCLTNNENNFDSVFTK